MDEQQGSNIVDVGVDLSEFYMSVEWDILEVPAVRWVTLEISYVIHILSINQWHIRIIDFTECFIGI